MRTKDLTLFVFDEEPHFQQHLEFLGKDSYKNIIRVDSLISLEKELSILNDDDFIFLATHAFFSDKIRGVQKFIASGIKDKYPLIGELYISEGSDKAIQKDMIEYEIPVAEVHRYHHVRSSIESGTIKVYTKKEVIENKEKATSSDKKNLNNNENIDYVIITALEEDEMEKVLPLITKLSNVPNDKHLINIGHFNSKPEKKVVYASQMSTGMIDASILATELIIRFNPKFVIMTGVLGGKPNKTNLGDVVISNKVFTIDKGKLTDTEFQHEIESTNTTSSHSTAILREKKEIIDFIAKEDTIYNKRIEIHFEPVACVRHVIDKEGYFIENISTIDRKSIALEMESYGIARACEIVNNGKTIPLIIKSVMDNTQDKDDGAKKLAAWTSAKVLEYIIKYDVI